MEIKIKYHDNYYLESTEDNPNHTPHGPYSKLISYSYTTPNTIAKSYIDNIFKYKRDISYAFINNKTFQYGADIMYNDINIETESSNIDYSLDIVLKYNKDILIEKKLSSIHFNCDDKKLNDYNINPKYYSRFRNANNMKDAEKHLNKFFKDIDVYLLKRLKAFAEEISKQISNKVKEERLKELKTKEESITIFKS